MILLPSFDKGGLAMPFEIKYGDLESDGVIEKLAQQYIDNASEADLKEWAYKYQVHLMKHIRKQRRIKARKSQQ